ncbi:MAG: citramalate synthase [Acetobacterales bacterium]
MSDDNRVYLYDCTLRDGAQMHGVDFNVVDKKAIARELDALGVDYVEGGWPGANPTDDTFFGDLPKLKSATLTSFGMTRRSGRSASNDPGITALLSPGTRAVCLVGKTWDFHAEVALGVSTDENLSMIRDSVAHCVAKQKETLFDAEHFFDGWKSNRAYALECVRAAYDAGARWVVLCDTNGGTLPHEVERIVSEVTHHIPGGRLGIHCHNDTENGVANSLAAVRAGVRQVQGCLNGLGERCGNANMISIIPNLMLKMGMETGISEAGLAHLTHVSRTLDERLNRAPNRGSPYVGESAFTHKAGLHASAVEKDPRTYEHIEPGLVGNQRHVVISGQAGRSNVLTRFRELGIELDEKDPRVRALVDEVKDREFQGFAYDGAEASFELLARRGLNEVPEYFRLQSFRVLDERRWNARGELITLSEATVKLEAGGASHMTVAEGNGPVSALDGALRKVLIPLFPLLEDLRLVDYKVRILTPSAGTSAITRVMIDSADRDGETWSTVGVSGNVIDASYQALHDSITYRLFRGGVTV